MRTLVAAVVLVASAGGLAAQEKKYESKAGKYAVLFPGEPTTESTKAGELTLNSAKAEAKGVVYIVIYTDPPAEALKKTKPEEFLETNEKSLLGSFKAKGAKSQATALGKEKYPARTAAAEVLVDTTTLHLRTELVLVENRLYQVLAIGPKDAVTGAAADKFFESFEVKK